MAQVHAFAACIVMLVAGTGARARERQVSEFPYDHAPAAAILVCAGTIAPADCDAHSAAETLVGWASPGRNRLRRPERGAPCRIWRGGARRPIRQGRLRQGNRAERLRGGVGRAFPDKESPRPHPLLWNSRRRYRDSNQFVSFPK